MTASKEVGSGSFNLGVIMKFDSIPWFCQPVFHIVLVVVNTLAWMYLPINIHDGHGGLVLLFAVIGVFTALISGAVILPTIHISIREWKRYLLNTYYVIEFVVGSAYDEIRPLI